MRLSLQLRVIAGLTLFVFAAPQGRAQGPGIFVTDFHSTTAGFYDLTATGRLQAAPNSELIVVLTRTDPTTTLKSEKKSSAQR